MSSDNSPFGGPGPAEQYRQALEEGRFMIQQCRQCGDHVFYPRVLCPACGSPQLKWVEASGKGEVYSTSVVRQKPEKGGDYNVALIQLEEGPRMLSRVVDLDPQDVRIGMPVSAHISVIDGQPAVIFSSKEQGVKEW